MAEKIFTVDKFLGLNESADSTTELMMGEASRIENFYITDGYNLKSRPGIRLFAPSGPEQTPYQAGDFLWSGFISGKEHLLWGSGGVLHGYCPEEERYDTVALPGSGGVKKVLQAGDDVYLLMQDADTVLTPKLFVNADGALDILLGAEPYIPLAITGCTPAGGGVTLEGLNVLTDKFRVQFTSDGEAYHYVLPSMVADVVGIHIGGTEYGYNSMGAFDKEKGHFQFNVPPEKDTEVVLVCTTEDEDLRAARQRLLAMPHHEYFNGTTDTRIFFYGDGSNVCYYSGIQTFPFTVGYGDSSAVSGDRDGTHNEASIYVPAGNEIAADYSDSPITAMVRHYSQLMLYKHDGTDSIAYEPMTLADGSVVAGFYLQPVNREFGNDAPGQVVLINNCPRSFTKGSIYEWRIASGYRDERNAKCISQKVARTMAAADPAKLTVCDDGVNKTYYVFLNDAEGTVLVNRYDLDVWSIYKSPLTRDVTRCINFRGEVLFVSGGRLYHFDPEEQLDEALQEGGQQIPIDAVWESGFMSFGADYKRKYSSRLWISVLPQSAASLDVTVQTDKRSEYLTKTVYHALTDFGRTDFSNFSFLTYAAPKIRRVQLKVKKFVYYKLIFRLTKPGTRATVLGYDQQVRYSSDVK